MIAIPAENGLSTWTCCMEGEKRLEISVMPEGNGVRIMIADNGRGYLPQVMSPTRGTGTGLKVSLSDNSVVECNKGAVNML